MSRFVSKMEEGTGGKNGKEERIDFEFGKDGVRRNTEK